MVDKAFIFFNNVEGDTLYKTNIYEHGQCLSE